MSISDKRKIVALLQDGTPEDILARLAELEPGRVLNPLFAGICHADERIHWNAVAAMGPTVARIADTDMESARIVMRRFMWSLNDESGGIGWGAPESMAEVMAHHKGLADEYAHILVSYTREDGNFLELPALQRGVVWGIGRLGQVRPDLMKKARAGLHTLPYLASVDSTVRGIASWALGVLKEHGARPELKKIVDDTSEVHLFSARKLIVTSVGELAKEALAGMSEK